MKQISKQHLDAILKEAKASKDKDVIVPNQFIIDIVSEVKILRRRVSKPKKVILNGVKS